MVKNAFTSTEQPTSITFLSMSGSFTSADTESATKGLMTGGIRLSADSLSDEDIIHYQRIIVALKETIRLMAENDEVVDAHGRWPLPGSTRIEMEGIYWELVSL
jgi:hypothetical protein